MSDPAGVRLWLARHGETAWSKAMRHTGSTDVPLTDHGREQAVALGERLAGIAWDAVLCSPLDRARSTLALAVPGVVPELLDDLRERDYGAAEGMVTAELRRTDPAWDSWRSPIPGAETIDAVGVRADRAIERAILLARAAPTVAEPSNVLVVSHGHLLRVLAARWIGQTATFGSRLALDVGTVSILGHERDRRVLRAWNTAA